jgi:hypothetical protein
MRLRSGTLPKRSIGDKPPTRTVSKALAGLPRGRPISANSERTPPRCDERPITQLSRSSTLRKVAKGTLGGYLSGGSRRIAATRKVPDMSLTGGIAAWGSDTRLPSDFEPIERIGRWMLFDCLAFNIAGKRMSESLQHSLHIRGRSLGD